MGTYTVEDAVCVAETDLAICVEAPDFEEGTWIPQSQIHEDSEIWEKGQEGDLVVTEWLAQQEGWI